MKFNHLIQINDPEYPLIEPLTREQLWRGLVLRAESPISFVLGLDSCRVLERYPDGLRRELRFGELRVFDRVTYDALQSVRYDTDAQGEMAAASLTMSIEEPAPMNLFVRFEYDIGGHVAETPVDAMYDDFRKSAYEEADIDTIARIRQLAEEGRLASN